MRIPGTSLTADVTLRPLRGNYGDGDVHGPVSRCRGQARTSVKVTGDSAGQSLATWSSIRVRPTVRVVGDDGTRRPPEPGDLASVDGGPERPIGAVTHVRGPGRSVAYLELTAGDAS